MRKITSLDIATVLSFHHQIRIYSSSLKHLIDLKIDDLKHTGSISKEDYEHLLEQISFKNQQINTISKITTVADFRMSAEEIEEDLILFSKQYLENVIADYHPIDVTWKHNEGEWIENFRLFEMINVI